MQNNTTNPNFQEEVSNTLNNNDRLKNKLNSTSKIINPKKDYSDMPMKIQDSLKVHHKSGSSNFTKEVSKNPSEFQTPKLHSNLNINASNLNQRLTHSHINLNSSFTNYNNPIESGQNSNNIRQSHLNNTYIPNQRQSTFHLNNNIISNNNENDEYYRRFSHLYIDPTMISNQNHQDNQNIYNNQNNKVNTLNPLTQVGTINSKSDLDLVNCNTNNSHIMTKKYSNSNLLTTKQNNSQIYGNESGYFDENEYDKTREVIGLIPEVQNIQNNITTIKTQLHTYENVYNSINNKIDQDKKEIQMKQAKEINELKKRIEEEERSKEKLKEYHERELILREENFYREKKLIEDELREELRRTVTDYEKKLFDEREFYEDVKFFKLAIK